MFRIKAMLVFMCLFLFALAETYSQTVMPIIKNCTTLGQEQFLSCERTLPNGEVQRARGACVCRNLGGMWDWQGGCTLPSATYTESNALGQTRTCTMPSEVRGCGTFSPVVDINPECGEWTGGLISPILTQCKVGDIEYLPSGECDTISRVCCAGDRALPTWSEWGKGCPTTCSTSNKPSTRTTCNGGYKYRTVTCNTSTGEWQTGSWGNCDCSDSAYEKVTLPGGGTCCQRKDGTGLRCFNDGEIPYGWVKMGTPCWNKIDCGTSPLPECNESLSGTYWSKWETSGGMVSTGCGSQYGHINGAGFCQQYLCRQGG